MAEIHKSRKILYNIVSGVGGQAVMILLGFMIPRLVLVNFGSEVNGVVNTVNQIFTYLCLLEAGVGLAALQALYAPAAYRQYENMNRILAAADRYYKKTGLIYGFLIVAFSVIYPFLVHSSLLRTEIFGIALFCGIPNTVSYLILGKYRLLLMAEGKNYVINNIETVMYIFNSTGKILLMLLSGSIVLVQAVQCVGIVCQVFIFRHYFRKHYEWLNLRVKPDYKAVSQKSSVLMHQISGVIFNNTDAFLLSVFCDFKVVSVYTTYNLFFIYLERVITTVTSGITFSLGQMFHTDRKKFVEYNDAYETLYMMIVFVLYTLMGIFLLPVLRLYTAGVTDTDYIDVRLLLLFIFVNLLANGKLPCNQIINFAEHFEQTRYKAVTEAVINITVSVIAIQFWGIYGGLAGTIAALLYRGNDMIFYANHKILNRSVLPTYRKWLVNMSVFLAFMSLTFISGRTCQTFFEIIFYAVPTGAAVILVYVIVNFITERSAFDKMREYLKEKRKDRWQFQK